MSLAETKRWFELAVPNPTGNNVSSQLGCMLEEVAELAEAYGLSDLQRPVELWANNFKESLIPVPTPNREELLDALCDVIVTCVGIAHMNNMDILGAYNEVNRSNFSKFVDGKPVFKANGKIGKGPGFIEPDLAPYL